MKNEKMYPSLPPTAFFLYLSTQNVLRETQEMAFPRPSIKNILGNIRSDSLFWSAFRALAFLPARTPSKSLAMALHAPKRFSEEDPKVPKIVYSSLVIQHFKVTDSGPDKKG